MIQFKKFYKSNTLTYTFFNCINIEQDSYTIFRYIYNFKQARKENCIKGLKEWLKVELLFIVVRKLNLSQFYSLFLYLFGSLDQKEKTSRKCCFKKKNSFSTEKKVYSILVDFVTKDI